MQARELATRDPGRPRQVSLSRAVSSAYYALFHALIDEACRLMFGSRHDEAAYRQILGRAFAHGTMKHACLSFAGGTLRAGVAKGLPGSFTIAPEIRRLAETFIALQDQRHLADYDGTERFNRSEVLLLVRRADTNLESFLVFPQTAEKKFFLLCLLTWTTLAGR
jgi:uncharacterized protein (UPF0332 family)